MTRILVTGSRGPLSPAQAARIRSLLARAIRSWMAHSDEGVTVVHGDAPGVDAIARDLALEMQPVGTGMHGEPHPADWGAHGKAAGPIRNAEMVKGGADAFFAFPDPATFRPGSGTFDCVRRAVQAGIPGQIFPIEPAP
jgi:hypothetical protein